MKIWDIVCDDQIQEGDQFDLELGDFLVETTVADVLDDGIVIHADVMTLKYIMEYIDTQLTEAEYQGRKVPLGKPMAGDSKKFKVYVKNPKGNVIKVNFGDKNMRIKKSNPKRRKSFRARHKCATAKDRTTARYWSCRKW